MPKRTLHSHLQITSLDKNRLTGDVWAEDTGKINAVFLLFSPLRFILVDLWLFSFPDTSTWLSNSYSASQHATTHCTRSRNRIYEFLAENCEFGVTVTYLILFSIFLDKYMYSFPDVSSKDFRDPSCSVPNFMAFIMVNSNHLLDPTNVPSLGHPPPGAWQPSFSKHM